MAEDEKNLPILDAAASYSLAVDLNNELSMASKFQDALRSHLVHSLLFNEKLILSDSQILRSVNLRTLISTEIGFRNLFNQENLYIAYREVPDFEFSLARINDRLIEIGNVQPKDFEGIDNSDKVLRDESILEDVESSAVLIPWSYEAVSNNFEDHIDHQVEVGRFQEMSGETRARDVFEMLEAYKAYRRTQPEFQDTSADISILGIDVFSKGLFTSYAEENGLKLSEQEDVLLRKVAAAAYKCGMPDYFGATPILETHDTESLEILDRRPTEFEAVLSDRSISARLDTAKLVEGLKLLRAGDIRDLRDSAAFKEVCKRRRHLDDSKDESFAELEKALTEYVREIEERILNVSGFLADDPRFTTDYQFQWYRSDGAPMVEGTGMALSILLAPLDMGLAAGILNSMMYFSANPVVGALEDKYFAKKKQRDADKREGDVKQAREAFKRDLKRMEKIAEVTPQRFYPGRWNDSRDNIIVGPRDPSRSTK